MNVVVRAAGPPTAVEREDAKRIQRHLESEPNRLQQAAINWRTGLAGVLALTLATTAFSSREDVESLRVTWTVILIATAAASVASAVLGLDQLLRAAYGSSRWERRSIDVPAEIADRDDLRRAGRHLSTGRWLAYSALALFLIAIVIQRVAPQETSPALSIVDGSGRSSCGSVKQTGNGSVTLQSGPVETKIPLNEASAVAPLRNCP